MAEMDPNNTTNQYLVDNTWVCGCGALNAAYRETCGRCNTIRPLDR